MKYMQVKNQDGQAEPISVMHASNSSSANTASYANQAMTDGNGDIIHSTYATKTELINGLSSKASTSGYYAGMSVGYATNCQNASNATTASTVNKYRHSITIYKNVSSGFDFYVFYRIDVINNSPTECNNFDLFIANYMTPNENIIDCYGSVTEYGGSSNTKVKYTFSSLRYRNNRLYPYTTPYEDSYNSVIAAENSFLETDGYTFKDKVTKI